MSTKLYCSYCGSCNHTYSYCPKTWNGQKNRNLLKCSYFGSKKHNVKSCPKLGRSDGAKILD